VLGSSFPFTLSLPMKAIVFYFSQIFWTNPSTISPFHAPTLSPFIIFTFGLVVKSIKELMGASKVHSQSF
jgi:hypothetical protein